MFRFIGSRLPYASMGTRMLHNSTKLFFSFNKKEILYKSISRPDDRVGYMLENDRKIEEELRKIVNIHNDDDSFQHKNTKHLVVVGERNWVLYKLDPVRFQKGFEIDLVKNFQKYPALQTLILATCNSEVYAQAISVRNKNLTIVAFGPELVTAKQMYAAEGPAGSKKYIKLKSDHLSVWRGGAKIVGSEASEIIKSTLSLDIFKGDPN